MNLGIDLIKLSSLSSTEKWNDFLTLCLSRRDINTLARTRRELQVGMNDLVNKKLNTEELCVLFARLDRSIEITAKKIIKILNPMPSDNPLSKYKTDIDAKRARDRSLAEFLKRSSY